MLHKIKSLGPGLLYAGAAIGVSHLVQSTKAGAIYGYALIMVVVLAHIFKYPFFVLGARYAQQTGSTLVSGYAKLGMWAVVLLLILTIGTMFSVQAAVTLVTAGLLQNAGIPLSASVLSLLLLAICLLLSRWGKWSILDNTMKVIMLVLSVSAVAAFFLSFSHADAPQIIRTSIFSFYNHKDIAFLLAFVGWMPAPLDLAIWHSIWYVARQSTVQKGDFDFNVGFYGTAFLAICFLVLGANTMFQQNTVLQETASGFASQLITVFSSSLGTWSTAIISVAAITTMVSTTLTCFDAMPRVIGHIGIELKLPKEVTNVHLWQIVLFTGTAIILSFFAQNMKQMVNFATVLSFLTAPVLAWLSYKLVASHKGDYPLWNNVEKNLAKFGILVLFVLSLVYIFL